MKNYQKTSKHDMFERGF